ERVDVGGVRVIQARGDLRLAQEAGAQLVGAALRQAEDLDDGVAAERRLLGAVDLALAARGDALAKHELAELADRRRRGGAVSGVHGLPVSSRGLPPRGARARPGVMIPSGRARRMCGRGYRQ